MTDFLFVSFVQEVYWSPELSTVTRFDRSLFPNSQELHFLIETDKYGGTNRLYLPGVPSAHHWDDSMALAHTVSFDIFWENFISYSTTSYIPSVQMSFNKASPVSSALTKIIYNCLDTPVRVEVEHIRIAECVKFINGQPSTLVCDENCSDIEMKCLSVVGNAQDDDTSMVNKISLSENYSNVSIDDHCDTVAEIIEPSRSEFLRKCYDCVNFCIDHNVEGENLPDEIIFQNFPNLRSLKSKVEKYTKLWLVVLRRYDFYMTNKLQTEICFDDSEFEELHRQSLSNAKQVEDWNKDDDVDEMIEQLVALRKTSFWNANVSNYEKEKQISASAQQMAVTRFHSLLEKALSVTTFSETEFSATYDKAVELTSQLFFQALGLYPTKPWLDEFAQLKQTLSSMRTNYVEQNQIRLSKIYEIRSVAIVCAKECYQKEMENNLPATMLATEKLDFISQTHSHTARRVFYEKIGKNINKKVAVTWEEELIQSIDQMKSIFLIKNDKLPPQPKPTIRIDRPNPIAQNFAQNEELVASPMPIAKLPTGIGVYIDKNTVIVCVDQPIPYGMAPFEVHHNIDIHNNGVISFGTDTSINDGRYYQHTVFQLLTDSQSWVLRSVNVEGRRIQMETEGILSLYFHRIRMEIEQKIKQRVSSCFVAITGLLTSKAKEMLKASLTIAGFERNTLIPSTTAMAILYWRRLDEPQRKFHRNLFIYISNNMIELALTDVSGDWIHVLDICGNFKQRDFSIKYLNNVVRDRQCTNVVVWTAQDSPLQVRSVVRKFFGDSFNKMNHINFNTSDVIKVAAMIDSNLNNSTQLHRIPGFNFVHPYRIFVERIKNGKPKSRVELSHSGGNVVVRSKTENSFFVRFEEQVVAEYERPFTVEDRYLQCFNEVSISLRGEGYVVISPKRGQEAYLADSMKPIMDRRTNYFRRQWEELELTSNNSRTQEPSSNSFSLERLSNGYIHAEPSIDSSIELPCNNGSSGKYERRLSHGASEKLSEDVKKSVTLLIEKTRLQLNSSQLTPAAHRAIIESKISKCETLMNSSSVKVKQLEIDKSLLERAAQLIK